jgi:hypothetical protein
MHHEDITPAHILQRAGLVLAVLEIALLVPAKGDTQPFGDPFPEGAACT